MDENCHLLSWIPGYALPAPLARTLTAVRGALPAATQTAHGPAGALLRYTPVYQAIRSAREEDDPTLPRGEWTRTLKRADWPQVIQQCEAALQGESKDFQLAAWLSEAWARQYGVDGICAGLMLFESMIEADWAHAYPSIDDGDLDARIGVFVWLRDTLNAALTWHYPLLTLDDRVITLDDWQRLLMTAPIPEDDDDNDGQHEEDGNATPPLTREALIHSTHGEALVRLAQIRASCMVALALLPAMVAKLDAAADRDTPSFERVALALTGLQRAASSLIDGRIPESDPFAPPPGAGALAVDIDAAGDPVHPVAQQGHAMAELVMMHPQEGDDVDALVSYDTHALDGTIRPLAFPSTPETLLAPLDPMLAAGTTLRPTSIALDTPSGPIVVHDREHAYQIIAAVATYLSQREPHSPTPYLLQRAVSWGQMSLPELLRTVINNEGDFSRFLSEIGVTSEQS